MYTYMFALIIEYDLNLHVGLYGQDYQWYSF